MIKQNDIIGTVVNRGEVQRDSIYRSNIAED